jgi:hypothetical protein
MTAWFVIDNWRKAEYIIKFISHFREINQNAFNRENQYVCYAKVMFLLKCLLFCLPSWYIASVIYTAASNP